MTSALSAYSYVSFVFCPNTFLTQFEKYGLHAIRYVNRLSCINMRTHSSSAWRVDPRNYLLLACHVTNTTAQLTQGYRFVNYWYRGGREKKLLEATSSPDAAPGKVTEAIKAAQAARQSTK